MTTIVLDFKNKQVAIDSRMSTSRMISTDECLKWVTNDNGIYFITGSVCDHLGITKLSHNEKVDVSPSAEAFLVTQKGEVFYISMNGEYCEWEPISHSCCIGSGMDFGISMLDAGKTAKDAVEYAMTRDYKTGGKVHVYDIEKGEFI